VGVATTSPYNVTWNNPPVGTNWLKAVAVGNGGLSATSSVVSVIVDIPPVVTLTNPTNNAYISPGNNVNLTVNASAADGAVKRVQYFQGTTSLGSNTSAPYSLTWSNASLGVYSLTAVAVDNLGLATTSGVVTVYVGSAATIIQQPTNETATIGNNALFRVTAIGTAPLIYQWYFGSAPIPNATNTTLLLTNVQSSSAGDYFVLVTNILNTVTSSNAILTVTPSVCTPASSNLLNWWPAENSVLDVIGGINGSLSGDITYGAGEVGQAFHFGGSDGLISFGNSVGNFGTNDFAIEFWVRTTAQSSGEYPILTKLPVCGPSSEFAIRLEGQGSSNPNPGTIMAEIGQSTNVAEPNHVVIQSVRTIADGLFHHVALTRQATNLLLYIDGTIETSGSTPGIVALSNSAPMLAGSSACVGVDGKSSYFAGDLDEIAIYNAALAPGSVQAIYNAASGGKCSMAPVIITQPGNQTATVGGTANFGVSAIGDLPLSYQWYGLRSGPLANATNATLVLTNLQTSNPDNYYYVIIANQYGSVASTSASLTVINSAIDGDGNGLPDAWEEYYFGTNGVDPNADPDGDGLSTLMEYRLGTNPRAYDSTQPGLPIGQGISDADRYYQILQGANGQAPAGAIVWFEITSSNPQSYTLLFHGTQPGVPYLLFSTQNPGPGCKWIVEQSFVGTTNQSSMQLTVNLWGRPSLTYRAAFGYDYDGNGIPDYWERIVAGAVIGTLNPNGDLDGDGVDNYDEFLQGRNPISPGTQPDSTGNFIALQPY
jgi:hypothetical protein